LVIISYFGIDFFKKRSLQKNYKLANAFVYKVNHGSLKGGNIAISYHLFIGNKTYDGGIDSDLSYDIREKILNTFFPVIYDSMNPDNNVLLIDIKRWRELDLNFPDSLKWVLKYYPKDRL